MRHNTLRRFALDAPFLDEPQTQTNWLWHGYLCEGEITLLTSQWKTGKTTLITGLLRQLASGGEFLGRPLRAGKAWIVSEESAAMWATRMRRRPIGAHVELMPRPFRGKPSPDEWQELVNDAIEARQKQELDLLVIDPLTAFFTGNSEADPAAVLAMLRPVQELATQGCSILILHHPRKKPSEEGASARGTGALLGYVDVILELSRLGRLTAETNQRLLVGQSRHQETPARLVYEWNATAETFTVLPDPTVKQYQQSWPVVEKILKGRVHAATAKELFVDWPPTETKPGLTTFYHWLTLATEEKKIRREGKGVNKDPWRFRLPNEADEYYDRGELPPLEALPWMRLPR